MKSRKTLEIKFPSPASASLFLWDGTALGYRFERDADGVTVRVAIQRRTARKAVAEVARYYGATHRTLVR